MWRPLVPLLSMVACMAPAGDAQRDKYYARRSCETGSCEPAVGNLLLGRENNLYASSTCGVNKLEKYCIVSNLEKQKKNTSCFLCDAFQRQWSHNVSNIVDVGKNDMWWQSENGVENVYIQLDMDVEFQFTHMIINFRTFRPAAMLIERSQDFGRTWQVYRYFAYDCTKYFPGVPTGHPRKLTDVVCDSKYSHVTPYNNGELIYKVLPPSMQQGIDPYANEIQDLVKMTNIRVNFTKLHTLGDNLLDRREEIQEKYYYAINHMIVRGSCSCYGHANGCVPGSDMRGNYYPSDMVHGHCECTHFTKGPNCRECMDLYNDLPWKAGFGKAQNACKQCACNGHASACRFNETIYNMSGHTSGGVCINCLHNTQGKNCEECVPYYYHDQRYSIQDPYACQPCECDTQGTTNDGVCDSRTDLALEMESGRCHCKPNVGGRRCDRCKEGFWSFNASNPLGCDPCSCNTLGTRDNLGCDVNSGECTCKRYVVGRDCNQCLKGFWGLSEIQDGCKACDCDRGGSYDNDCDVLTGQCKCRPHMTGRTCSQPESSFFTGFPDFHVYEAELAKTTPDVKIQIIEPTRDGREVLWTGTGYVRVYENSQLEFYIDNIPSPLDYNIVIRYAPQLPQGWRNVNVKVVHLDSVEADSSCANSPIGLDKDTSLDPYSRSVTVQPPVCMEPGKRYKVILTFEKYDPGNEVVSASVLIDSLVLFPLIEALPILLPDDKEEFERYRCGEAFYQPDHGELPRVCLKFLKSIGPYVYQGASKCDCNATGSRSFECEPLGGQCDCKPNVIGRQCEMCAPGTFDFGPEGCRACDCDSLALDNICDPVSGQCKCRNNTYGRACDQCLVGFWNFPNCQRCECNGHAATCDPRTGVCIDCLNFTVGQHCETCLEGFYGEPIIGYDIPCRACPCPGSADSGHSYAKRCSLDRYTQDVRCECEEGYAGARCDVCAENYYGNPEVPGGSCNPCECNNNVDVTRPGNCDPKTGKCLQCLYNTEGDHCEICKERYFGDALQQQCAECVCDILGSNRTAEYCNRTSGQCPCLPNVIGLQCDECLENHWRIATGLGCEPCNCDKVGSHTAQCNPYDGQCHCREGFGSRQCDHCEYYHWGDPKKECYKCDCESSGSITQQCQRDNGTCICVDGIGGDRCDRCARGYLGQAPHCTSCGECFQNWDNILNNLRDETNVLLLQAADIKEVGVWGAYTSEFGEIEKDLADVNRQLVNINITRQFRNNLGVEIRAFEELANASANRTIDTVRKLEDTDQTVKRTDLALAGLRKEMDDLLKSADDLKENATRLQEANVEGALNLTRKARKDSQEAEEAAIRASETHLVNSERQCKRAMVMYNRSHDGITKEISDNEQVLERLKLSLEKLETNIPAINEQICGKREVCDAACGGAGCGFCGGISCDTGATTKANLSLELLNKAEIAIKDKESKTEELLRGVSLAKSEAANAKSASQLAFDKAEAARNSSDEAMKSAVAFTTKLDAFMAIAGAKPSEIRALADETRKLNLNLQPSEVKELALKISTVARDLKDIDNILHQTDTNKTAANKIRDEANDAKGDAESILNAVQSVGNALEEAADAQTKADSAIRQARVDIAAADKHLTQISSESSEAQAKASETLAAVKDQMNRLQLVNIEFTKNKLSADEIKREVDSLSEETNATLETMAVLKQKYQEVDKILTDKANHNKSLQDRAKNLAERARKFYIATAQKEKDLQDLEKSYRDRNLQLEQLKDKMKGLSDEMEIYLDIIEKRSAYYASCIA